MAAVAGIALAGTLAGCMQGGDKPDPTPSASTAESADALPLPTGPVPEPRATSTPVPEFAQEPVLGNAFTPPAWDGEVWAATPAVSVGSTLVVGNDLMGDPGDGMWDMGAGVEAYDLTTGQEVWKVDFTDPAFGFGDSTDYSDISAFIASDGEALVAVMTTSLTSSAGEEEVAENGEIAIDDAASESQFSLVAIDPAKGEILSSVKGAGADPLIAAVGAGTIAYSTDGESITALAADKLDGEPLWSAPASETAFDATMGDALFTGEGWKYLANGEAANVNVDLTDLASYLVVSQTEIVTSSWDGATTSNVELIDPATGQPKWSAAVPSAEDDTETILATASAIIMAFEGEDTNRAIALDRATGEQLWTSGAGAAFQASDNWVLLDSGLDEEPVHVVGAADGLEAMTIAPGEAAVKDILLANDHVYIADAGKLQGFDPTGESAAADEPLWTLDLDSEAAWVTADYGPVLTIDEDTGALRGISAAK
jgi:outer membrane protein assembly factor BamB